MVLFARRRGETTHMCRILPTAALEFGPIEELRQKHGTLAAVRRCRARISQNPISLSNLTPKPPDRRYHWLSG